MSTENTTTAIVSANAAVNFGALLEKAIRNKLRFETPKGQLSVEDLFDLNLTSTTAGAATLDNLAINLDAQVKAKADKVVSFVKPAPQKADYTQLKLDIVLYILNEKMAERDARADAAERAEKKQKIMAIIARKQDGALEEASLEDLMKMAQSL